MTTATAGASLQSYRPTIYLDQWVWIRMARAASGKPDAPADRKLLADLVAAANMGVAFPLSWTHYIETQGIKNPRQRRDVADVMAAISHFRTLRSRRDLLRNQLLIAMHEQFSRPTFRPPNLDPLGVGVHWAFQGLEGVFKVHNAAGEIIDIEQFPGELLVRATQGLECQVLAGPDGEEERLLREHFGYRPEATAEAGRSRLDWEQTFVGLLADTPPKDPAELRVWIQACEVANENLEILNEAFTEYGLPIRRLIGGFRDDVEQRQRFLSEFFDRLPSVRVAVDLKLAIHRNNTRGWAKNDVYDIDAMAIAVPYCHVVVPDGAVADALSRVKAGDRHGTTILRSPAELQEVLPGMVQRAMTLPDPIGWEKFSPGVGFNPLMPDQIVEELRKR